MVCNSWASALGQVPLGGLCGSGRAPRGLDQLQVSWLALLLRVLSIVGWGPLFPMGWPWLFPRTGFQKRAPGHSRPPEAQRWHALAPDKFWCWPEQVRSPACQRKRWGHKLNLSAQGAAKTRREAGTQGKDRSGLCALRLPHCVSAGLGTRDPHRSCDSPTAGRQKSRVSKHPSVSPTKRLGDFSFPLKSFE